MKTDSFIFYRSFYEAIKEIPDEERLKVYDSICEYALNHTEKADTPISKGMMMLITPQLDANFKRRANGALGGKPKTAQSDEESEDKADNQGASDNQSVTKSKPNHNQNVTKTEPKRNLNVTKGEPNVNDNVNDNVNVNVNGNVNANKRFTPPSLEDVIAYCDERKNNVNAQRFYDYHNIAGWKDSKGNPVKNWKQKMIANWESKAVKPEQTDIIPVYDTSTNKKLSDDEMEYLLSLRRS